MAMTSRQPSEVFVIRLRAAPKVDAIRALRAGLKVLGRRFGLRAISITSELEGDQANRRIESAG
jgi:hypothetical protein